MISINNNYLEHYIVLKNILKFELVLLLMYYKIWLLILLKDLKKILLIKIH